ncbi:fimbrial protein [Yersinia canariae]|uniref:fimbrial protein n=2 Tax=Yersinia canariae TaxID=2607663 RepID=UPI00216A70BC|nr:fimbrial protein [Yersinia canariae]
MFSLASKNKIHNKPWYFILILSVIYIFIPNISTAAIKCNGYIQYAPKAVNFKFQNTSMIGQEISFSSAHNGIECTGLAPNNVGETIIFKLIPNKGQLVTGTSIFESGLSGVGLKFDVYKAANSYLDCSTDPIRLEHKCLIKTVSTDNKLKIDLSIHIYLVKLDMNHDIGTFRSQTYDWVSYMESDGPSTAQSTATIPHSWDFYVSSNTCTLNTQNLNFDLGTQQQNDFTGIGSTGHEQIKQIDFTCDPNTRYFLQVDGDADNNHPGVIKLTPAPGVATGVGVQLLAGQTKDPVVFSQPKQMGTTAASGGNLSETIDITARYYQTENKVTGGPANASATFTMTYQ